MSNEPERTDGSALSLARYPGPACSYSIVDGDAVLQSTNDSFVDLCGAQSGDVLDGALERLQFCGTKPTFERETQACVQLASDSSQYDVEVIPPTAEESGYLLFTQTENDGCDPVGVDRVASVISHDLRNPLDVALARLRAGRELDSDEHLEHVAQAHDRMERIIQDVLTLARGEDVVDPDESVDLGTVAAAAWETVETNGADLEVVSDLPETEVDRDRVSRLFENLFRNAVEHGSTSPGSQQDAVEHGSEATENGHTHVVVGGHEDGFYVADDGPGVPEGEREEIFEPGYSSSDHGTGLGLAIVEQIAQLHGWSIRVTTSAEGGARFEITGVDPN
jgi:two-component sensor histidine kinase